MESGRLRSYKDMNISNSIGMPRTIVVWLVVSTLWKILVSWDYSSQYMEKYKMFQTTNQWFIGKIWKVFGDASWFSSNKAPFCSKSKYVCSQYEHMRLSKHGSYIYFPQIHHFIKKNGKTYDKMEVCPIFRLAHMVLRQLFLPTAKWCSSQRTHVFRGDMVFHIEESVPLF
jgi:hypothetical protein